VPAEHDPGEQESRFNAPLSQCTCLCCQVEARPFPGSFLIGRPFCRRRRGSQAATWLQMSQHGHSAAIMNMLCACHNGLSAPRSLLIILLQPFALVTGAPLRASPTRFVTFTHTSCLANSKSPWIQSWANSKSYKLGDLDALVESCKLGEFKAILGNRLPSWPARRVAGLRPCR